tara:strand:- start:4270 stop:5583 length:1314 start_codon:yes stop_codon:yes gene_type:complete
MFKKLTFALLSIAILTSALHGQTPEEVVEAVTETAASIEVEVSNLDSGDTAWMLMSTALVLFMMIPGLALFYGGLVNKRNVLSVLMHCFALTALLSIVWLIIGYTLAFSGHGKWLGDLGALFHKGVEGGDGIPNILFSAFQMTFFVITPGLIVGTFVERVKFNAVLIFSVLWALVVYAPICHMTWSPGGWFYEMGVVDLAGGIVVHITAGVAALVFCIMLGARKDPRPPHNLPMTVIGAAMLWVGWFGFNAGSQGGANEAAALTLFVTHISASAGALTWMFIEWKTIGKPSILGIATGSIAGLAAITPASGVAGPLGALLIGTVSGALCWYASVKLKNRFKYDDSLDVVGVHGVGGLVGTLLAALVGIEAMGGGGGFTFGEQIVKQAIGAGVTTVYTLVATIALLYLTKLLCGGLRVSEREEIDGLDQSDHGETAYN